MKTMIPTEASNFFLDAFIHGSSMIVDCQCGATHFATQEGDYEEGQLKRLLQESRADPEKYHAHVGFTSHVDIDGKCFAVGCACGELLARYEEWIWHERRDILNYLKGRIESETAQALDDTERIKDRIAVFHRGEDATVLVSHMLNAQQCVARMAKKAKS